MSSLGENQFFIWGEKNSTEVIANSKSNQISDQSDTIKSTRKSVIEKQWSDIGKISGVYKIVNKTNGKYYTGSSKNINERWKIHKRGLRGNRHYNVHLQSAWNKYGETAFNFVVVETADEKDLLMLEQRYLDIAKNEKDKCYNMYFTAGGGDVGHLIYEARSKKYCGANHPMYGKHHSDETKEKIRLARQGTGGPTHPLYGRKKAENAVEKRRDQTLFRFKHTITGEEIECTKAQFNKRTNGRGSYPLIFGRIETSKGWRFVSPAPGKC